MGNDYLYVIVASQHVAAYHVRYGTSGLREVFLHGKRRLLHHLLIDRFRAMWMQDDDSPSLVQHSEKRVEFGGTKILSVNVCGQLDAVSLQYV